MKNTKATLILVMLMTALMVLLTACGGNQLVGTWVLVDAEGSEMNGFETEAIAMVTALGGSMKVIFTDKEMTLSAEMFGMTENQTVPYAVKGNTLIVDSGNALGFEIKNDTLTLSEGESYLVLARIKK